MIKKIKNNRYIKYLQSLDWFQRVLHFSIIIIVMGLSIWSIWAFTGFIVALFIFMIYATFSNSKFQKQAVGNGAIVGGRGKGKGLLLNKRINTDKNKKHFTNVPYNKHSMIFNIKEYIDSILPNTINDFIKGTVKHVNKVEKFESVNVYWDDVAVYAPNHMDSQLKQYYPSLSAILPINRHLYNAYMIITVQDVDRPYKLLRELQTDFVCEAIKSSGWGYIWQSIPILNMISTTKYIYYEKTKAASNGMLPFNAKAIVNETLKHGYLTSGQATKEQYEATNGKISYGRIWQLKKNIKYDTRYFHRVVFGSKSPTTNDNVY